MDLTLRVRPVAPWSPARARAFDVGIADGEITLNLREIDWRPTPKIEAAVQVLEGDDANREFSYFLAGGAP